MNGEDLLQISYLRQLCTSGVARALREGAGLSLQDVGGAVGVKTSTLWRWETGNRQPLATAQALRYAHFLDELASCRLPRRERELVR